MGVVHKTLYQYCDALKPDDMHNKGRLVICKDEYNSIEFDTLLVRHWNTLVVHKVRLRSLENGDQALAAGSYC